MSEYLRVSVSTVEALFSQHRVVRLPWFQRAYAWREDNVLRLVADVMAAMAEPKQRYSLGHIHFAGLTGEGDVALVDGHQRAITLALLFAILRDIAAGDVTRPSSERASEQQRLHALISIAGDYAPDRGTAAWRLVTQPQMAEFFERYVQQPGGTLIDPDVDETDLTPAERNLINNRDRLRYILGPAKLAPAKRMQFVDFLLSHCHLIVIEVDDEDEAWSMIGIEQTTRLPHDASEQAKIALIYAMPAAEQEEAGQVWESVQSQLGNERIRELLSHLRTRAVEKRSTKPLEGALQQLYKLNEDGLGFMYKVFRPNADAMRRIDERQIGSGVMAGIIARHIDVLSWLDHRLWMSPAIAWLTSKGDLHKETESFFASLDRLAWMMRLAGTDPHEQENRFIQLTRAAERKSPAGTWDEFAVSDKTVEDALAILRSRTFYFKHMCPRVLRRLSYQGGVDPGFVDGEKISVEHVLPRKPPKDRQWLKDFSASTVAEHADRLGNLTLLTGPQNRKADTNDWPVKQKILSQSNLTLSIDAAKHARWTPRTVSDRTEKLIALLFAEWSIPVTPP
jgi:hypothetical protein